MSLCTLAISRREITVIENAQSDPLLSNHPYVAGELGLRFYAAAPVVNYDKQLIGTMCLIDTKPRVLSAHEQEILHELAGIVMQQTELRLSNLEHLENQQRITEQLQHSERHLMGILDTMAEGVTIVDTNGRPTYTNGMAEKIFGLNGDELRLRNYNDDEWTNLRLDGSILTEADHLTMVMLQTGHAVYNQEIGIKRPDGEIFYILINAAPLYDHQNVLTGGICTFTDATNRRRLMNEKDEFISIASHELKTPITSLQAALQIMNRIKDKPDNQMMPALIKQANKSLDKLNLLVRDLLSVNRISAGQLDLRKTVFTIADMINDCCEPYQCRG